MPFDNTPLVTPLDPPAKVAPKECSPVEFLDLLLAVFDDGRRWIRGVLSSHGRRCLVGAINHVQKTHRLTPNSVYQAADVLCQAFSVPLPILSSNDDGLYYARRGGLSALHEGALIGYNDTAADFSEIRALILKAREIALQKPEPKPATPKATRTARQWRAVLSARPRRPCGGCTPFIAVQKPEPKPTAPKAERRQTEQDELAAWARRYVERLVAEYRAAQECREIISAAKAAYLAGECFRKAARVTA